MSIFDDMDNLVQVQAHLAHWREQLADGRRKDDFLFGVQAKGIIATLEHKEVVLQAAQARAGEVSPSAKAVRLNEFWWITSPGWGLPDPTPARVTYRDGMPAEVLALGQDECFRPEDVRLIERVLPAGRAAAVVAKLQDAWNDQACPGPADDIAEAIEFLQGAETRA